MQYYSTNHHSPKVTLKEAMMRSEAPDGGLYMPERLPVLPKAIINNIADMSVSDLSYIITNSLLAGDIPSAQIKRIGEQALSFPMPIYEIEPGIYVVELFHGPTMTVKDIGARFFGATLRSMHCTHNQPLNVLMASNGNSGNAIANVFHGVEGINVFVLFPRGLDRHQVEQISSYGDNIHAIEVTGHLENCASLIHRAFIDPDLADLAFTSANSYNICSLMPYPAVYFGAMAKLLKICGRPGQVVMSIPTGCCGNLLGAYMAKLMGMPVSHLIAACNENTGFKHVLDRGIECVHEDTHHSYAHAMDMPRSANMPRFIQLCGGDRSRLRRDITAETATDAEIADIINDLYDRTGYLLDPHGAVAYACLKKQLPTGATGIFFATSHPARSTAALEAINRGKLKIPRQIKNKRSCPRPEARIQPTYGAFKKYIQYTAEPARLRNRV